MNSSGSNKPLDSSLINDAISKLPNGHNWGIVKVEMGYYISEDGGSVRMPLGDAECIDTGRKVVHSPFGWVDRIS